MYLYLYKNRPWGSYGAGWAIRVFCFGGLRSGPRASPTDPIQGSRGGRPLGPTNVQTLEIIGPERCPLGGP